MSGIPAETLLLCLVCGVLLGFVFAVLEFLRLLQKASSKSATMRPLKNSK